MRCNKIGEPVQYNVIPGSCSKVNFKYQALCSFNRMYMIHQVMSGSLFLIRKPLQLLALLPPNNTCHASLQISNIFTIF